MPQHDPADPQVGKRSAEHTTEPNFELVLERLASEFYRSPEVLRAVARKILEQKERASK